MTGVLHHSSIHISTMWRRKIYLNPFDVGNIHDQPRYFPFGNSRNNCGGRFPEPNSPALLPRTATMEMRVRFSWSVEYSRVDSSIGLRRRGPHFRSLVFS